MALLTDHSSHAVLVREKRIAKARKMSAILSRTGVEVRGASLLDVGTGGGFIAEHFARLGAVVSAVDRQNQLPPDSAISLTIVPGNDLPFPDKSFDIVISNHVIEHVGPTEHLAHLRELRRVCKGVAYLATPNRWTVGLEPHFKLPFLSWLPTSLRSTYVRLVGKGQKYDVWPLARRECMELAALAGFSVTDMTGLALRLMADEIRLPQLAKAPLWLGRLPTIPTFVLLLR